MDSSASVPRSWFGDSTPNSSFQSRICVFVLVSRSVSSSTVRMHGPMSGVELVDRLVEQGVDEYDAIDVLEQQYDRCVRC